MYFDDYIADAGNGSTQLIGILMLTVRDSEKKKYCYCFTNVSLFLLRATSSETETESSGYLRISLDISEYLWIPPGYLWISPYIYGYPRISPYISGYLWISDTRYTSPLSCTIFTCVYF